MRRVFPVAILLCTQLVRAVPSVDGSYVVRTVNGHVLPAEIRIPTTGGDFRLFQLDQGVLTLKAGGRFTLHFRYHHQLVRRGTRPTSTPVLSESETEPTDSKATDCS